MDWQPVLDPFVGGYHPDFDREQRYQFRRNGEDEVYSFRLADMHPLFNIAGLDWREEQGGAEIDPEATKAKAKAVALLLRASVF